MLIGVDTGGTFTDLALYHQGAMLTHKLPSTPEDFARGVLDGIRELMSEAGSRGQPLPTEFTLIHSSTVATNALLERKGARTALIATRGFRDVLEIGRQTRPELYNLHVQRRPPLVPRALRHEVSERVTADGEILCPLDMEQVDRLLNHLATEQVESLAVSLLFSFLHPEHERAIGRAARHRGFTVSLSSEVLPEFREYERTSTTVVNAYVSPVMGRYIRRLARIARRLGANHLRIMQSNGGSLSASNASRRAVTTLLSGPSAGVIGALHVARRALQSSEDDADVNIITFDMGGTSTDVSLIAGDYRASTEAEVGGHPVCVPMIDIHTVGAGGGSLAHLDAGGALQVGPQSAGADPGPACCGRSDQPTVTDANLILNRIEPGHFLGGRIPLDVERAERAIDTLAAAMGAERSAAARSVIRIVNANMEAALRVISVARGHDPRDFTLVSFGGAGGLHACHLAEALRISRVLVPRDPGVLSALGTLVADSIKDYSQTVMLPADATPNAKIRRALDRLGRQAVRDLVREGHPEEAVTLHPSLDVRYAGQSYEVSVPFTQDLGKTTRAFHKAHQRLYGHSAPEEPIEVVTARVRGVVAMDKPTPQPIPVHRDEGSPEPIVSRGKVPVYDRSALLAGDTIVGEALVVEDFATTLIPEGWRASVDSWGNFLVKHEGRRP